ncbi:MAG: hypothetical protein DME76_09740 [Verrucomicrobia bacterium]|nr:MAG: hypothetical protein DME76_09740 [Verrucomicrobiota bacterium]
MLDFNEVVYGQKIVNIYCPANLNAQPFDSGFGVELSATIILVGNVNVSEIRAAVKRQKS